MKTYFLVQSSGRTATQWPTKALTSHNDIFCSHGKDLNPNLNDSEERFIRIHKDAEKFINLGVDSYFDFLEKHSDKKVIGNIHGGFNTTDILTNPRMFARDYNLCYLVRKGENY